MSNLGKILIWGGVGALAWYGYKIYTVIKNIEVNFSSLKIHKIDKSGIKLTVGIEFDNTEGRTDFTMQRLRLRIYLDGSKVAEVNDNDKLLIGAYSSVRQQYDVSLSWADLGTNIVNIIRNFNDKISVGVKGVIYVNNIPVTIGDDKVAEFNLNSELKNLKGEIEDIIGNVNMGVDAVKSIFTLFKKNKSDNYEDFIDELKIDTDYLNSISGIGRMNIQ